MLNTVTVKATACQLPKFVHSISVYLVLGGAAVNPSTLALLNRVLDLSSHPGVVCGIVFIIRLGRQASIAVEVMNWNSLN